MEFFRLEKPEINEKEDADAIGKVLVAQNDTKTAIGRFVRESNEPEYRSWDQLKFKQPLPPGLNAKQMWAIVKFYRRLERRLSPIKNEQGQNFGWVKLDIFERYCHEIDLHAGGWLMTIRDLTNDEKRRLISSGLMEEAIASSQLEGADTTREYAKKMLRENITPRNASDQMILNNHVAMQATERDFRSRKMSMDLLLEMHSMLTEKTLDTWKQTPKLRETDEALYVQDLIEGVVYHKAPSVAFVKKELAQLIAFANDESEEDKFLHPVIKAAMLHFWLGYLHPFTDGNGRLARILFYWYTLRKEYWAFSYLPITAKIKAGGKKGYTMAYVKAEQDDQDLTYFISYLLGKIDEAYGDFSAHVAEFRQRNARVTNAARTTHGLNERQTTLVGFFASDPDNTSTIASHARVSGISRLTATKDLDGLVKKGFATRKKIGREVYFRGTEKAASLLTRQ